MARRFRSCTRVFCFQNLILGLIAAFVFALCIENVWGRSPDIGVSYCDPSTPAQDVTLFIGDLGAGVALPRTFGNGTTQPVTFTTTINTNVFFGSAHVIGRVTVPAGISFTVFDSFLGVDETTPLGTATVVIEVTSTASGTSVLGRCTFNLTVTRRTDQRDVITIPVRFCFIEGTQLAFNDRTGKSFEPGQRASTHGILSLIDKASDEAWLKHARIFFFAASAPGVPVVKDPFPPDGSPSFDVLGAVEVPQFGELERGEAGMVKVACEQEWQKIDPTVKGIVLVFVRKFKDGGNALGVTPKAATELIQRQTRSETSTRLCQQPRQLQVGDLTHVGWTLVLEPDAPVPTHPADETFQTVAHEFGHALLLGHGNGLDDDADGLLPPMPGPRRFDEYCDKRDLDRFGTPLEDTPFSSCEQNASLMHVSASNCLLLRPLQVEQARAAAKLVPGANFDASIDPAGTLISDVIDLTSTGIPPDVLLTTVEIAETPALALTEISQNVVASVPTAAHNRYTTIIDVDNNPNTGCNAADLGFPTGFAGAELVTSVSLDAVGGPPQLTSTVWRCQMGTLTRLSDTSITPRATNTELADTIGSGILGRISVVLPTSLVGPHPDVIRVQGIAEQVGTGGKMSRVPSAPTAGGPISLVARSLPTCSVNAPVLNLGSITRVHAAGLFAGGTVDLLLGGDTIGTGRVDSSGSADLELAIPGTSRFGVRPVTMMVRETLSLASCEVEIVPKFESNDTTPPNITPQITGILGNNGWYRSNVTVGWNVTDLESGVASTTGCDATTLTAESPGVTVTCSAKNSAGLSRSVSVTIKIDKTAPAISGMPASGCSLWPPDHKLVTVATIAASDSLAGLSSLTVTGISNEPPNPGESDIVITGNALQPRTVQLRAERLPNGTGRTYTLTASATDLAGNTRSLSAVCTVPHDQSK